MKIFTYILTFIAALLWASAFVGIKIGLTSYTPDTLALLRYIVASIAIAPAYLKYRKRHKSITAGEIIKIIPLGLIGIAFYNIALNSGEIQITSAIASFIISQTPILMVLFAIVFLKERINRIAGIGILISFLGVMLIASESAQHVAVGLGMLYVFLAALASAIYAIMQKPLLLKFHGIELTAFAIWSGTLAMMVFLPKLIIELPHANIHATLVAIYMGIFPGALAYAVWSMILARSPASQAIGFLYIIPILTILLSWILLGEIPLFISLLGGFIALFGAVILHYNKQIKDHFPTLNKKLKKYIIRISKMKGENMDLTESLIDAVIANDAKTVKELLEQGADPNGVEDGDNVTLLHFAVSYKAMAVIPLLLEAGANPSATDISGSFPLDYTCGSDKAEIEELFAKFSQQLK